MGLFHSYENAGPGIDPNAPKKKPFFRFWELLWRNLGKLFLLNIIYSMLHIPLMASLVVFMETNNKFTDAMTVFLVAVQFLVEGPAIAGCARVLRLIVLDKPFFFSDEFKKGFKQNFGAGLLYWFIDALVIASLIAGHLVYPQMANESGSKAVFIPFGITVAIALVLLFMNYYIWPLQVATRLDKRTILKNSFMLSGLSLKECAISTLGSVLMIGIVAGLWFLNNGLIFILAFFPAAFIGYLVMFVHYPVVQRFVINPYYEESGERNPEEEEEIPDEDRVFTDRGGTEQPVKVEHKKGKVIS
ncbi:MAG: hypothetical protein J5722_01750 [Oscillospiraceae bacterium]|nr:hypothetical protein [Oscillospiraceae bacterium]